VPETLVTETRPVVLPAEVEPADPGPRTGTRVAVLVSLNFPDLTEHVADLVRQLTRTALEQLAALGADWRLIDTSADLPALATALDTDAVLVLGGGDVDSELYGVVGPVPGEYGVDPEVDRWTMRAVRGAVDEGIPVLAVCRGSQLLNVAFGGTIVPDLEPADLHKGGPDALFIDETVRVDPGTRLAAILGAEEVTVRSGHHQAVDRIAPALRRAAVAADGVVEGVEHPEAWAIGVQWHPEEMEADAEHRALLWRALCDAATATTGTAGTVAGQDEGAA
jgi:putative glutamine amidotransferase